MLVVAIIVIGVALWRKFSLRRFVPGDNATLPDSPSDSAIISFYSAGHLLARAGSGTLDDMRFASYVTTPAMDTSNAFTGGFAIINVLDLPFNTDTHMIGLSKQHGIDRVAFANFVQANGMERVELEGDFSDYFDLFAAKGEQIDVRSVLAPDAMAYVVDYCGQHFWEINRAEMYFVGSTEDKAAGDIFQEARDFVGKIKPALKPGQPGAPVVHHEVAYGEYDGPPLKCPICSEPMASNNLWHVCPDAHGVLISGRELIGVRNGTIKIPVSVDKAVEHGALTCPNCQHPMSLVDYEGTGVEIDSCENCPYRWLDANEIDRLVSKLPSN